MAIMNSKIDAHQLKEQMFATFDKSGLSVKYPANRQNTERFDALVADGPAAKGDLRVPYTDYQRWAETLSDEHLQKILSVLAARKLIGVGVFISTIRKRSANAVTAEWSRRQQEQGHGETQKKGPERSP